MDQNSCQNGHGRTLTNKHDFLLTGDVIKIISFLTLFAQIITPKSDNTAEILKGLRYILFAMNISNIQSFSVEKNRVVNYY